MRGMRSRNETGRATLKSQVTHRKSCAAEKMGLISPISSSAWTLVAQAGGATTEVRRIACVPFIRRERRGRRHQASRSMTAKAQMALRGAGGYINQKPRNARVFVFSPLFPHAYSRFAKLRPV